MSNRFVGLTSSDAPIESYAESAPGCGVLTHHWPDQELMSEPPTTVVIVNGFLEDRQTADLYAGNLVTIAADAGHNFHAVTYDDPPSYEQADRVERLRRVVTHLAGRVILNGHSLGWRTSVEATPDLDGMVDGILGMAGAGHTPLDDLRAFKARVVWMAAQEVFSRHHIDDVRTGLGSLAIAGFLGRNLLKHVGGDIGRAEEQIRDILTTDITDEAAALSQALPMAMLAARGDSLCPGEPMARRLMDAGFQGPVDVYDTCHGGMLTNVRYTRVAQERIIDLQELARAA